MFLPVTRCTQYLHDIYRRNMMNTICFELYLSYLYSEIKILRKKNPDKFSSENRQTWRKRVYFCGTIETRLFQLCMHFSQRVDNVDLLCVHMSLIDELWICNKSIYIYLYIYIYIYQGLSKHQEGSSTPMTKVTKFIVVFLDLLGAIQM